MEWIGLVIAAVISAIVTFVATDATNTANAQSVDDTNESNLQAVRETNQSNVEQAELAYQRSLPSAQVRALMDAGMSRAGALSSLTGGGTYTAPVLQSGSSQAKSFDYSGIAQAFQHFNNIPSNVEQLKLQKEQLEELKVRTENAKAAELRAKEQHQFDMWQKLYGKDATLKIDALASDIVSQAADKDISLDSIDSIDKLVNTFDLKNNKIWRTMPNFARSQVLEGVRLQAAENRAQQTQSNANQAAFDAHNKALDDLKSSELGRSLTSKQIQKINTELSSLELHIQDFKDESDARKKEYKLRGLRADFESLASQFNLKMHDLKEQFYFDEDGNPKLKTINTQNAKEFWNMVSKTIGLETVGDILSGIISIASKG